MTDELDEFKDVFYTECYELLTDMESRLLSIEGHPNILDELNAIFRCAHSIKGGAGAFNMNGIMRYTHRLETLLDALRNGSIPATRPMIDGLLKAKDIVLSMVEAEQAGSLLPESTGEDVLLLLEAFAAGEDAPAPAHHAAPSAPAASAAVAAGATKQYSIRYEPVANSFINGNDPLVLLHALSQLGTLDVSCDTSGLPDMDDYKADESYLAWDIVLETTAAEAEVREIFGFVDAGTFVGIELLDDGSNAPLAQLDDMPSYALMEIADEPVAASAPIEAAPVTVVAPAPIAAAPSAPAADAKPAAQQQHAAASPPFG